MDQLPQQQENQIQDVLTLDTTTESNLIGFFVLLARIDRRLKQEEQRESEEDHLIP